MEETVASKELVRFSKIIALKHFGGWKEEMLRRF
jgi:hypothetical protein